MTATNILLTFLLLGVTSCNSYRILAIFPFKGKSHYNVLQSVALELAKRGHQVDVITHYPLKEPVPNYTDIIHLPPGNVPKMEYAFLTDTVRENKWLSMHKQQMCEYLGLPEVSKLIKNPPTNPPYDLLITHILLGNQCFTAIGHLWNIPVIVVATTDLHPPMHDLIANPMNFAIATRHVEFYKDNMNFWDRLYNVVKTHYRIHQYHQWSKEQDYYIKKYLGPQMPHYRELHKSIAIILSNSHYSYYGVQPKAPAFIEIGGIHIKNSSDEISPSIQKYLDESKHGFFYFSFGSLFSIESLPKPVLDKFYAVLRKIAPVRVVMRAPNPELMPKNMPGNVLTFSWLPQQKVLQHPNIRAFVSHGGGLGTQEAIYYKVPMICVPFFSDQFLNCDVSSHKNISIKLDIRNAPQKDYDFAFREILSNPFYKESVNKLSVLYRDRLQSPQEAVVYWTEYVIRHGKNVLQSPAIHLKWWQLELLDVYAFLLLCTLIIAFVVNYVLRRMFKLFIPKLSLIKFISFKSDKKLK